MQVWIQIWIICLTVSVTFILCLPVAWIRICACLKADLWICLCAFICVCLGCVSQHDCVSLSLFSACMCLSVSSLCVCLLCVSMLNCLTLLSLSVYLSPIKASLFLLNSTKRIIWKKEWEIFTEIFNRVYKALRHWIQLVTTDTDNKHYLSTNIQAQNFYDRF